MPRPQKIGLDYFPLDTKLDDKLELIEAKYELIGYAIILKLWSKIYNNGYWYKWTEREELLFKKQNNLDLNLLKDIVKQGLEWDIFDLDMYKKYQILTSNGIQKRYLFAIKGRINQEFIEEYCLFDLNEYVNSVKHKVNVVKTLLNTHTILKNTIVNNSKPNREPPQVVALQSLFENIEFKFTKEEIENCKDDFFRKWAEKSDNGKKERWQMEKTFDVNLRFRTWIRNDKEWHPKKWNEKSEHKSENDPINELFWNVYRTKKIVKDNKEHILILYQKKVLDTEIINEIGFNNSFWVKWYCPECDKVYPVKYESLPEKLKKRWNNIEKLIKEKVSESIGRD